jgi:hypothetical protein
MKGPRRSLLARSGKYDLLLIALVILAIALVLVVWAWYGMKSAQLERQIYLLK